MTQQRFYFDLQVHTDRYSDCSRLPAAELILTARARGLDGLLLTDHDHLWSAVEVEELKQQADSPDFVVLRGVELRTEHEGVRTGDLLAIGMSRLPDLPLTIDQTCIEAHRQGALVIAPHPYAGGQGIRDEIHWAAIDAVEVYNNRYRSMDPSGRARREWGRTPLPAVAGSDAHSLAELGRCCTEFIDPIRSE